MEEERTYIFYMDRHSVFASNGALKLGLRRCFRSSPWIAWSQYLLMAGFSALACAKPLAEQRPRRHPCLDGERSDKTG